jgi:hypothetical protein
MILSVFVVLAAVGFLLWTGGYLLGYTGIAVIGAAFVLGAGAMVTLGGLEYKTGEVHSQTSANETVVENQYSTVDAPTRFPLGILVMLVGGLLNVRALTNSTFG